MMMVLSMMATDTKGKIELAKGDSSFLKMDCYDCVPADQKPPVDIEILEKEIPEIDWRKGHSGELLSEETAEKLDELWNKIM
jgi:hypothetical protein